jgi:trans-2,3-dihydro-3-hydroxyanthranilate isomerase
MPDPKQLDFEAYIFTTMDHGPSTMDHGPSTIDHRPWTMYSRMFAPQFGIIEDPATGSAGGPLGSYLVRHSVVTPEQGMTLLNLQGAKMGRPSWIHISIESRNGGISRVRVGGASVFVAEGVMEVED